MTIVDVMGVQLVAIEPARSVREAIGKMMEARVGAVAVCEGPRLVGIFTERDVLRLAGEGADLEVLRVGEVMTTRLVVVGPSDDIADAARLMREHEIRHLPVVDGENLLGVVGIREVLAALAERLYRTHDDDVRQTMHELLSRRRPG
jgi:CBS domain-containing protein